MSKPGRGGLPTALLVVVHWREAYTDLEIAFDERLSAPDNFPLPLIAMQTNETDVDSKGSRQADGPGRIPEMIRRSQAAFRRDLPALLQDPRLYRRWVAYHGDERIGIAKFEHILYQQCARRALKDDEYVVRCIVPEIPQDSDSTPSFDV